MLPQKTEHEFAASRALTKQAPDRLAGTRMMSRQETKYLLKADQVRILRLSPGRSLSLLLHALLLLLVLRVPRPPEFHHAVTRRLNVEITTPRANRQVTELHKHIERPRPSERTIPKSQIKETVSKLAPQRTTDLDIEIRAIKIHSDLPDALRLPQTSVVPAVHAAGAPSQKGDSDIQQRQLTVGRRNDEADLINAYVSMLSKLINSHLLYPSEARKKGLEGVSWVSFVVTDAGAIKGNSLSIKTSSGYAVLDKSALQTITSVVPFPKPPRELTVSLGIDFSVAR